MIAYFVLLLAVLSRLVPHALHGVGLNITAVSGGLLYFGARRPRAQALFAVAVLAAVDVYLTRYVYGYPFQLRDYFFTWTWYGVVCLLGSALLQRATVLRACAAVLASATGFYVLSNLVVWVSGGLYPKTTGGLETCYVAALPFYGNDLVSTGLTTGVLFGLPVVAASLLKLLDEAMGHNAPLT